MRTVRNGSLEVDERQNFRWPSAMKREGCVHLASRHICRKVDYLSGNAVAHPSPLRQVVHQARWVQVGPFPNAAISYHQASPADERCKFLGPTEYFKRRRVDH